MHCLFAFSFVTLGLVASLLVNPINAADHLDSPSFGADGRVDINDLFAFQSPSIPNNTGLIMTVNPLAGVFSDTLFYSSATYEFHIDSHGDAISDLSLPMALRTCEKQALPPIPTWPFWMPLLVKVDWGPSIQFRSTHPSTV